MKLSYLIRGLPGHPLHPPLTDAAIGAYTVAAALGFVDVIGLAERNAAKGWWLALLVGLIVTAPTALTGLADWFDIRRGSPLWRTATFHMISMLAATVFFLLAAILGHGDYEEGGLGTTSFVLTLVGFGLLTLGGWLGGTIVYVYGMRVVALSELRAAQAVAPVPTPEKEAAEAGESAEAGERTEPAEPAGPAEER